MKELLGLLIVKVSLSQIIAGAEYPNPTCIPMLNIPKATYRVYIKLQGYAKGYQHTVLEEMK